MFRAGVFRTTSILEGTPVLTWQQYKTSVSLKVNIPKGSLTYDIATTKQVCLFGLAWDLNFTPMSRHWTLLHHCNRRYCLDMGLVGNNHLTNNHLVTTYVIVASLILGGNSLM